MSRPNKNKISTDAPATGGLFAAFVGLEIGGLPKGPETLEPSATGAETAADKHHPAKLGRVVLRREKAHRGGKCVIVADGFAPALDEAFLEALAKRLRAACGCGGAVKERTIELQGDQVPRIRECLLAEGFRVDGVR